MLSGLNVAYAALEPFPNAKGSGTRIAEFVAALAASGARVRLYTLPGRHAELELPSGVEHRALAVHEPNFLRRALAFRERVHRELHSARPDVIHFRGVFEGEAALSYAVPRRVPCVFEVNGLPSVELPYHYPSVARAGEFLTKLRGAERAALEGASLVLTQSHTTLGFLRGHGLSEGSATAVIPNGANPARYEPRAHDPSRAPRLLYAGTLASWQGVNELLMAMRRVRRVSSAVLTLAGPVRSRWRKQLERALRRLGVADAVVLSGALDRESLARAVSDSDICLAPLRIDYRNAAQGSSPIKLFEYMAAGRALVSTDLPCVREIVRHEQTGLLARSPRPSTLAEQIVRLLDDALLRARLGANARAEILRSGTWQQRGRALLDCYARLLKSPSGASSW